MKRTPEQAKQAWCPFARVAAQESYAPQYAYSHFDTHGIAVNHPAINGSMPVAVSRSWANNGNASPYTNCLAEKCMAWRPVDEKHGICGLAGPMFMP